MVAVLEVGISEEATERPLNLTQPSQSPFGLFLGVKNLAQPDKSPLLKLTLASQGPEGQMSAGSGPLKSAALKESQP